MRAAAPIGASRFERGGWHDLDHDQPDSPSRDGLWRAAGRRHQVVKELFLYFAACVVTAMAALPLLRWRFPQWGVRRTTVLSALPVPAATILLCAWVAVKTALTPASRCGVDACGMAMAFALIVAVIALVCFVLIWGLCAAIVILRRRRT